MPLYDAKCTEHGKLEVFQLLSDFHKGLECPECGRSMLRVVSPVVQSGPSEDRPLRINQIGKTFTSNAQVRDYLKENPDCEMVSSSSSSWKELKHEARNSADEYYREKGYKDKEDYRSNIRKDLAEQKRESAAKKP